MKAPIIVLVLFFGITFTFNSYLYGQSAIEIGDFIKNTIPAKSSTDDLENLKSLYYDFNTTVVLSKDNVKIVGKENPKAILINLSDIDAVYAKNSDYLEVEILIVSIKDKKYTDFDLSNLKYLSKLKYIVFKSNVLIGAEDISSFIANSKDVNYILLYDISIPQ